MVKPVWNRGLALTGVPPLPPPPATAPVAARVVAVSVTATARADMMFMREVMVLSKVHSWGARPVTGATLAAPRPPRLCQLPSATDLPSHELM
jgi:hypothetical protein